jgi:hypothetical protein
MRVLVANEPRSYREAIARVLVQTRPHVETVTADAEVLAEAVRRFAPDLVVCSAIDEALAARLGAWIELYPEGHALARVCIDGRRSTLENPDLAEVLAVVDAAAASNGRAAAAAT